MTNRETPLEETEATTIPCSVTITEGFSIQVPIEKLKALQNKEQSGVLEMDDITSFHPERCHHEATLWVEQSLK